ncbi:MAG: DUF1998 domain-containing protein [Chloroflexales bacterium]|jgi:Domain of unknown function (DUF1998)
MNPIKTRKVGEVRPSQTIFSYGVGALIDLPNLSVAVTGLDDWHVRSNEARVVVEERLLRAIRAQIGPQVERMYTPPMLPPGQAMIATDAPEARIGVPVNLFPRWFSCPVCDQIAPWSDGIFELRGDHVHAERAKVVHLTCPGPRRRASGAEAPKVKVVPQVVPARFLVACENGHLDDFPWLEFVHRGQPPCKHPHLTLTERSPAGEARDIWVACEGEGCDMPARPLSDAFGEKARAQLPRCRGRRPHLRDFEERPCDCRLRPILLGASNLWFADVLTALAVPTAENRIDQVVEQRWNLFEDTPDLATLERDRRKFPDAFSDFRGVPSADLWAAVERKRQRDTSGEVDDPADLKTPEWRLFSRPQQHTPTRDFQLREVDVPRDFRAEIARVVLVERLREVRALIGFTRIDAPGEYGDTPDAVKPRRMRLSRRDPSWVPAAEVRGEGLFIQFHEQAIQTWLQQPAITQRDAVFLDAHRAWRAARGLTPPSEHYPGARYVLLHTFAHVLMRQLVLECGYTAASLRERIYARNPFEHPRRPDPMAGILIYTAATDSEGTLGGLVTMGEPEALNRHLTAALFDAAFCTSDPLCAEHAPDNHGLAIHGAACHACLFAPETSCERGNKYLDRAMMVPTLSQPDLAFFTVPQ